MSVRIDLASLHPPGDIPGTTEVEGDTIGQCLNHLKERFPTLNLFDKGGKPLAYLGIYLNGENAYPDELSKPVRDGDEISIVLMFDGG